MAPLLSVEIDVLVRSIDHAFEDALRALEVGRALQQGPGVDSALLAQVHTQLGLFRFEEGDPEGAREDFSQAIRLNPTYVRAYNNRGGARKSFGDLHGALKDYDQAIKLDPKYVKAYYNRANTRRIGGDLQGAIKDYDQAIKLNPKWWPAWLEKGVLLCRKNRRSEGLRALRQAHQLAPKRSRPRIVAQIKRWQAKR